jgi:hypothetical protein
MAPTGLKEVDSLKIELVVDNDIEWYITALLAAERDFKR